MIDKEKRRLLSNVCFCKLSTISRFKKKQKVKIISIYNSIFALAISLHSMAINYIVEKINN
jgi:hypothetical protein